MTRIALALALLLMPAAAGPKKGAKPKEGPVWAKSWTDALTEGRILNLPIVVHRHGFY